MQASIIQAFKSVISIELLFSISRILTFIVISLAAIAMNNENNVLILSCLYFRLSEHKVANKS